MSAALFWRVSNISNASNQPRSQGLLWSKRERETLENTGHVSPRIWEMTKDNTEGGAGKSGVWLYLAHQGMVSICIKYNTSGLCHSEKLRQVILPMRGQNVEYKVYAASSHVNTSSCRLCKSVRDIAHSKNYRVLLTAAEELYSGSFSQSELLPHLICRPCERRVNNLKAFKNTITETQTSFERIKRCIEVPPSAPQALKSSKVNEPLVVRSRHGINFGDEQPSGNRGSKAI